MMTSRHDDDALGLDHGIVPVGALTPTVPSPLQLNHHFPVVAFEPRKKEAPLCFKLCSTYHRLTLVENLLDQAHFTGLATDY